jgi:transglutaminase superfamily protein
MQLMAGYFLSKHAFACETGGRVVFLDLRRDRYSVVDPWDVAVVRERVRGWPIADAHDNGAVQTEALCGLAAPGPDRSSSVRGNPAKGPHEVDGGNVIDQLIRAGLLTTEAASGKYAAPLELETPTRTLLATSWAWPAISRDDLRNFVSAWTLTTLMLRTLPISWVVGRARRRKAREAASAPPFDVYRLRQLAMMHMALRPVFYDAKDACLRDSLTLIEFLSRYRIYPTWAFGVRVGPFAAHSWVQCGSTLLTDPLDHVKTFTPIMLT